MITFCLNRRCEPSHTPRVFMGERVVVSLTLLGRTGDPVPVLVLNSFRWGIPRGHGASHLIPSDRSVQNSMVHSGKGAGRSPSMRRKISANRGLGMAASARRQVM